MKYKRIPSHRVMPLSSMPLSSILSRVFYPTVYASILWPRVPSLHEPFSCFHPPTCEFLDKSLCLLRVSSAEVSKTVQIFISLYVTLRFVPGSSDNCRCGVGRIDAGSATVVRMLVSHQPHDAAVAAAAAAKR